MNSVDDDTIMITVFGRRTTVGLVRFFAAITAQNIAAILKSLQGNESGFSFDASDVSALPVFADS
jgi:hypothetical protein